MTPGHSRGLLVTGEALSMDNLVVGVALSTHRVPVALAATLVATVGVGMSLLRLEIGRRLALLFGQVNSQSLLLGKLSLQE